MSVSILIPAYKPDRTLVQLVQDLRQAGLSHIVLVDDGGGPKYAALFEELKDCCTVLVHPQNQGKGAALKTGMAYLMQARPDDIGTVTVDADGQHRLPDIQKVVRELQQHPQALVLGVRSFTGPGIPLRSRLGNLVTRFVFFAVVGKFVRDTQTGLRGIPQSAMASLIRLEPNRYEYELEMLLACRKRAFRQVTIETVYIEENRSSHFNPVADSLKIYATLFRCRLKHLRNWFLGRKSD